MIPKKYLLSSYSFIVALCASFLFASCGSYQYVGYENDGIYNDDVVYQETPNSVTTDANSSSYYKSYFDEKASELDTPENEIFTDVDSYQSNYTEEGYVEDNNMAYAGWGQNGSEVQINVYNNRPFYGGFGLYGGGSMALTMDFMIRPFLEMVFMEMDFMEITSVFMTRSFTVMVMAIMVSSWETDLIDTLFMATISTEMDITAIDTMEIHIPIIPEDALRQLS